MNFTQTSSIIGRFRTIIIGLGFLLVLQFAGFVLSSRTLRTGLRSLSEINSLTALASRGAENLKIALETVEKEASDPKAKSTQLEPIYDAAKTRAVSAIDTALKVNSLGGNVKRLFLDAKSSAQELNQSAKKIFQARSLTPAQKEELQKDLLLVKEFEMDASESLRGAQIELSKSDTQIFSGIYHARLNPLLISFGLALIILTCAWLYGLATIRHLRRSLENLSQATDAVAHGNLDVHPPVLASDEIGKLTLAFDSMVQNLDKSLKSAKSSAARNSRLLNITAAFSRAVDLKSVAGAMVFYGSEELGAKAGLVSVLNEAGDSLEIIAHYGANPELLEKYRTFSINAPLPSAETIRNRTSVFVESKREYQERFHLDTADINIPGAVAVVPLIVEGNAVGSIRFAFLHDKKFTQEERNFVTTLADLAAQSFQRASLYNSAQKAIHVRDEFLSIASHELKTPITSLKMQLQLALRQTKPEENQTPKPEKLAHMLQSSVHQVDRLTSLVDDLLDVSRMEAGKFLLNFSVFDLKETLKTVLERFESILQAEKCQPIVSRLDEVKIFGDRIRLEQVIINLLSNAMKYGGGKPIEIALVKQSDKLAQLSIRDQGIGVPKEKQPFIFDRFERAAGNLKVPGLGLGLYIAKQIVESHNGKIWVESRLGKGSTFFVELPIQTD